MIVSVLTDNKAGAYTGAEHGLSYLIEFNNKKLLFDTGQSNLFIKNAGIMGVSLNNIDFIILSHGHFDHGNGLQYCKGGKLICHPGCFTKRYRKSDFSYIGLANTKEEMAATFDLILSIEPFQIDENIIFLGEIPRNTDFEAKTTSFVFEDGTPDFVQDDSAITININEGLFIFTGCGHSGIVNIMEHAKQVTGIQKLHGIMGGFHLKKTNRQTKETIRYLNKNGIKHVLPSHCTEPPALSLFHKTFSSKPVKTGDIYKF